MSSKQAVVYVCALSNSAEAVVITEGHPHMPEQRVYYLTNVVPGLLKWLFHFYL